MSTTSYTTDIKDKISLHPSQKAIKRAALALLVALGIATSADFGYGYLTTGRYLESVSYTHLTLPTNREV